MTDALTGSPATHDALPMTATERLDRVIRDGLALTGATDVRSIAWGETAEWDSVAHMQLVAALEAAFGIMIDTDDVIAMSDYSEICRIVGQRYGVGVAT